MARTITTPRVLSVKDVQGMLEVSLPTIYKLVGQAEPPFPVVRIGTRYKIPSEPFLRWLNRDASEHSDDTPAPTSGGETSIRRSIRFKKNGDRIDPEKWYRKGDRAVLGADLIAGTW